MDKKLTTSDIDQILEEGFQFDLGNAISKGWDLMVKEIWLVIGAGIVFTFISFFSILTIVGVFVIIPSLIAGFICVAHRGNIKKKVSFSNFFDGFQSFLPLIVLMILQFLVAVLASVPSLVYQSGFYSGLFDLYSSGDLHSISNLEQPNVLVNYALSIPGYVVTVLYSFSMCFVVIGKMGAWEAMEASRKVVMKKFWLFLGFFIVLYILMMAGMMALILGGLITFPLFFFATYAAYTQITENVADYEGDREGDISDHLVV